MPRLLPHLSNRRPHRPKVTWITVSRLAGLCLLAVVAFATPAGAHWTAGGTGAGTGFAATMPAGQQPSASVAAQDVTVSWAQSQFLGAPLGSYAGGGYTLKRYAEDSSTATTPGASCATTISGATATLQCVEAGVPYGRWQYTVTPLLNTFSGGESTRSAAVGVATDAPVLTSATAQNPTAEQQTSGDIQLSWAAAAGATGYNVYRRTTDTTYDFGSPLNGATPLSAGTTYTDPGGGLVAATTYHYVVRAVAGSPGVESISSNAISVIPISRPAAPAGVTATAAAGTVVNVAWSSVPGAAGYNVYRRAAAGSYDFGAPLNGATPLTITGYADASAVDATSYHYTLRAVITGAGGAQVESLSSVESAVVSADGTAPAAPTMVSVTNGHVLPAVRCSIAAGTRFVNNASKTAVNLSATLAAAEPGATVVFSATTPASTVVSGSAPAAASTTATLNLTSLVDGVLTLTAYSRDAAGNVSSATAMTAAVRKDVVFTPALTIRFSSGLLGVGAKVSGNAECGADVVATKNGTQVTGIAGSGNTYEISVSGVLASSGWTATATDPAGNTAGPVSD